ncbi:rhodanese-related sulfurtransferase [Paramagnetospirillum caucaseum]|uniref:Rhodanese-related sulfurtransferase n=1 Tax=Paramagnetospirillum caucaseum TaxID=1244869 RepID=M2Y657_9PROT|nr:rhodanese-like domain-containing protein [Paramagnetospirillum caucaseum]EME68546.1 rhodanese-related sulfurtransferase [Paramagnetospirillum caucaseum]
MLSRLFGLSPSPASDKVHVVEPAQIRQWWEAGSIVLVDVRESDEYAAEAIAGSINLPLSTFDPARMPRPEEGKRLVIHCRSGVRCGTATAKLLAAGWDGEINRMQGGILGWKAAGGPTVPGR